MQPSPLLLMLAAVLFSMPTYGQVTPSTAPSASATTRGQLLADRRAALLEVVPPSAMQQSPAAVALIDRLMRKHVLLLQDPSLSWEVISSPDVAKTRFRKKDDAADRLINATRVRVISDTNVIELMIDPAVGGDESALLAEAIINEHLKNQDRIAQNYKLAHAVMLNNLKQRYQFRKDDLSRELREKAVLLSIDGMSAPGRPGIKEVELQQLLSMRLELERKKNEVVPETVESLDVQLKQVNERIDSVKQDLGDLTNAVNQYFTLKDEETNLRELLNEVNKQLDEMSQNVNASPPEVRWLRIPNRG